MQFTALLAADGVDGFDQFNQIDQTRRAASVCQYRANRNDQARRRFIESGLTATGVMRAQCLDDSLIEIGQPIGHTPGDQPGAALSKLDTRTACFVHVVHRMRGVATARGTPAGRTPTSINTSQTDN